jgi:class 3 adenylate cyclase
VTEPRKERKVVTVVFADLVGFTERAETLDPEDVEQILRPYHERLRTELERFGGTVEKFIGDAVMAVFGAPIAREDDPERAVRAALAIRDWALEAGEVEVRVAINTGRRSSRSTRVPKQAKRWSPAMSSTLPPACRPRRRRTGSSWGSRHTARRST